MPNGVERRNDYISITRTIILKFSTGHKYIINPRTGVGGLIYKGCPSVCREYLSDLIDEGNINLHGHTARLSAGGDYATTLATHTVHVRHWRVGVFVNGD